MGRESRRKEAGRALQTAGAVSNFDPALPDATVSSRLTRFDRAPWMERAGATSLDPLPEDGDAYAKGTHQLFDKFIQGRLPVDRQSFLAIVVIACFGFVAWLFVQDNSASRLTNLGAIGWFWIKALQILLMAGLALALLWRLFRKK